MRALAYLLYALIVAVLVLFAVGNWDSVTLRLWGDLVMDIRLPVLMAAMLVLGALPGWVSGGISRFRLKRRIRQLEREIDDARAEKSVDAPVPAIAESAQTLPSSHPGV